MDSSMADDGTAGQGVGATREFAMRRDAPVKCPACGRSVARKARQQRYCSERCKEKARERSRKCALESEFTERPETAPQCVSHSRQGGDTGAPTDSLEFVNEINGLQIQNQRPSPGILPVAVKRLEGAACRAVLRLAWPGWTEADYFRALRGAKAWVVDRAPAGAVGSKARKAAPVARPSVQPAMAHSKMAGSHASA